MEYKNETSLLGDMPEIYSAIKITFNLPNDLVAIVSKISVLSIEEIEIYYSSQNSFLQLTLAMVKNEKFWCISDALKKMFSFVDCALSELREITIIYHGSVTIDVAFYQHGTYPALDFDGDNMRKIHYLNADISIDAYGPL